MQITLDLSFYPFTAQYEEEVIAFIKLLELVGCSARVNALSTQIQGEFPEVWDAVGQAVASTFSRGARASLVIKVLPGDIDLNYIHPTD